MAGAGRIARAFGNADLAARLAAESTPPVIKAYHGSPTAGAGVARAALSLPPIPDGHVRLTHVTSPEVRKILEGGEPFLARKGIELTTDSYSNNADIEHLVATGDPMGVPNGGKPSVFSRNSFGDQVVLMDLPADAHKLLHQSRVFTDPIPNYAIVGYIDRAENAFTPNPRHSLLSTQAFGADATERIRALQQELYRRPQLPTPEGPALNPIPALSDPGADVW